MRRLVCCMAAAASLAALSGCGLDMPGMPDGRGTFLVTVADTSGLFPGSVAGEPFYLDSVEVRLDSRTHMFGAVQTTNEAGVTCFDHLATGSYSVFARREILLGSAKKTFTGSFTALIMGDKTLSDTLVVNLINSSQLMINEIYYMGSCASTFYFYDQFCELYNSSNDTLYLDGCIVTRQLGTIDPEMEQKDYVTAIYAFQFPGTPVTGREYPIYPKQLLAIAQDAVNHSRYCSASIDLTNADWEFFNQLGSDYDNLLVPNLLNIIPNKTTDWMISLGHNAVVIATGEEYTIDSDNHVRLPISTVIDGVEYSANSSSSKELTVRVDAGFAGINLVKYGGQSTERRELGLDTNDSTFDFWNPPYPTPGYYYAH
ncbi:MAG: DUF4876 domain-containing protein [Candidatus Krumholzibacteria bacterium]|nr:DUF4876 domain-containing protein [Candidatus Krumholzibacteria bacterium]